jgi:glycosyltransferase involved in cell wall biosynthesis
LIDQSDSQAKPNIIFFIPTLSVGGAERHTVDLCQRLRARGFKCQILVHGSLRSDVLTQMDGANDAIFMNIRGMSEFFGWIKTWRMLKKLRPDIVVAVNQTPFIVAFILRLFLIKKYKTACIFHTTKMQIFEQYQEKILRLFAPWLDLMIYVGATQRQIWEARGIKPKSTKVILNGIDLPRFNEPTLNIRSQLGIEPNEFILGILASFRIEKNHTELVQALSLVHKKGICARILMIGDGKTQTDTRNIAHDLGVLDKIIFVGEQSDVRPYIQACDMGILCSTVETFPLSVIEFIASGIPVIASNVGGLSEIIENGVNGLLYESGNIESLASHIVNCSNADFRQNLCFNTQKSAARFGAEHMSEAYAKTFQSLIKA